MSFDRFDICAAYNVYDVSWGPTPYGARLHRMRYRPSSLECLETLGENAKAIYGDLVMRHQTLYVAYERLWRRAKGRVAGVRAWPGTDNMGCGSREWLRRKGLLAAVECYARDP